MGGWALKLPAFSISGGSRAQDNSAAFPLILNSAQTPHSSKEVSASLTSVRLSRRQAVQALYSGAVLCGTLLFNLNNSGDAAANDALFKGDGWTPTGDPRKLETYLPHIYAGYEALKDLQKNWDKKTEALDGDVVRRVLGTVGVSSPLFNIRKSFLGAWKAVVESGKADTDVIDELEGMWNDILNSISSIDFQLYSVNFTELLQTKENLIRQGKSELDATVETYRNFLQKLSSTSQ